MRSTNDIECELLVIGAGMAGMAAALFAANRGVDVVQVGTPGEIIYASGLLDLIGVHPIERGRLWRNPWSALDAVRRSAPEHPYARLSNETIRCALKEFIDFLAVFGLSYRCYRNRNVDVVTPAGTVKRTYAVPQSMWPGVLAWQRKAGCLLVDFTGLKGFSARQIRSVLQNRWPGLRSARLPFPGLSGELFPERMAQYLELPSSRRELAAAVRPLLEDAAVVGFPAVCGLTRTTEVVADLEQRIGRPVFEIPTLPPAVTGLRIKYTFERALPELGVRTFYQNKVTAMKSADATSLTYRLACGDEIRRIRAQATVLASGRFIGQGLRADRQKIHETIFDLPVTQPPHRCDWHQPEFLDRRGHPANRAGLEIDHGFRPRQADGRPAFRHLYAAGSILAHADWMRMKCGAGLAIATAYGAVNAFQARRNSVGQSPLDESSRPPLAGTPRGW